MLLAHSSVAFLLLSIVLSPLSLALTVNNLLRDQIFIAQCNARCMQLYGTERNNTLNSIYDIYLGYQCQTEECRHCSVPCKHAFNGKGAEHCVNNECWNDTRFQKICSGSCEFLYSLKASDVVRDSGAFPNGMERPEMVCRTASSVFLRWDLLGPSSANYSGGPPAVQFLVEMRPFGRAAGQFLGLETSSFVQIKNLRADNQYAFTVTAVAFDGVVSRQESEWMKMWFNATQLKPAQNMSVDRQFLSGDKVSAILSWQPSEDRTCFYKLYWMPSSSNTGSYQEKVIAAPPRPRAVVDNLNIDSSYEVILIGTDDSLGHESAKLKLKFTTINCPPNYKSVLCPPDAPSGLRYTMEQKILSGAETRRSADLLLSWTPPGGYFEGFKLHYRKLFTWKQLPNEPPQQNIVSLRSNDTSYRVTNIDPSYRYEVLLWAFSAGGKILSSPVRVTIGSLEPKRLSGSSATDVAVVVTAAGALSGQQTPGGASAVKVLLGLSPLLISILVVVGCVTAFRTGLIRPPACLAARWQSAPKFDPDHMLTEKNPFYDTHIGMDSIAVPNSLADWSLDNLLLDNQPIGSGCFGQVFHAKLAVDTIHFQRGADVAVKFLKDEDGYEKNTLASEAEALMQLSDGGHRNIIRLVVFSQHSARGAYLVTEFCPLGDLKTYLQQYLAERGESILWRPYFVAVTEEIRKFSNAPSTDSGYSSTNVSAGAPSELCTSSCFHHHDDASSRNRTPSITSTGSAHIAHNLDHEDLLDTLPLANYAYQIAAAMEFLVARHIIHRDLAARNVLVYEKHTVKLSDFGLSRFVGPHDGVYFQASAQKLPMRWMAPEVLTSRQHSTASDVWSFGIVLLELITFGATPYQGVDNLVIVQTICSGIRPRLPDYAEKFSKQLMYDCWQLQPTERPSFGELKSRLERVIASQSDYLTVVE